MSGVEVHIITQRNQFVQYAAHDPTVITAWQIGSANALSEERVTGQQQFVFRIVEGNMSGVCPGVSII